MPMVDWAHNKVRCRGGHCVAGKAESGKQKAEMGGHCVAVDPLRGVPGSWFLVLNSTPGTP